MERRLLALAGLVIVCGSASALAEDPATVRLKSRTFIPVPGHEALDEAVRGGTDTRHFYVQLAGPFRETMRDELAGLGVSLLQYVPGHTWIAGFSTAALSDPAVRDALSWVGEILPNDKRPTHWDTHGLAEWAVQPDGRVKLRIRLHGDAARDAAADRLRGLGVGIGHPIGVFPGFVVVAAEGTIADILELDEVLWVAEWRPPIELANDGNRSVTGAEVVQVAPYDLSGQGVRVAIWDAGRVDPNHDDFAGRLTQGESSSTHDHATHCGGTFGGSGVLSEGEGGSPLQWRGMAPECLIYTYDFYGDVPAEIENGIGTYDLEIETNSWTWGVSGSSCYLYGDYDSWAPEFDAIVRGSGGRALNVCFAAANERDDGDCPLTEGGYGCIPPPSTAKNIITVGATNSDDDTMTDFSSWGPVDDGRVKPDVTAPGCEHYGEEHVHSTMPGDTYGGKCGTSMATPTVAGCLALLYELYHAQHPGENPEPSLMKALLVATGQDLGNPGTDYAYGHGRIDVQAAADAMLEATQLLVSIAHGQTEEIAFEVPETAPALRFALAWDDPPGNPGSGPALVNDLDLELIDPSSTHHYPWVLDPEHPSGDATRGVDNLNNVEHVEVAGPVAGTWRLRISGTNVPEGPQIAGLVGLDLNAPESPVDFHVAGSTETSIDLTWENASNTDRKGTVIVRGRGPIFWAGLTDGATYHEGEELSSGVVVVYVRNEDHSEIPFTDAGLDPNTMYSYFAHTFDEMHNYSDAATAFGSTEGDVTVEALAGVPAALSLGPARPNPAKTRVSIELATPGTGELRLTLYDAVGRRVRTLLSGSVGAGIYRVTWDGRDAAGRTAAPGVYFYELRMDGERLSERLAWMR